MEANMESVFDMAAGLTDVGLGENINPKDKEFIKLYYGGSGLVECANYYAKRFNEQKDYFACFIVAEFCRIQGGFAKAVKYYESLCTQVNSESKCVFRHIDGRELKLDWRTLKPIVAESYSKLGKIYSDSTMQDFTKAATFYKQGCDLDDAECFRALGFLCQEGNGVEQSYEKAIKFYLKAAELGDIEAYCNLGFLYEEGRGVEADYHKALEFYQKAADSGSAGAHFNLGYMYQYGYGVERDYKKAINLYQKSANMGFAEAYCNLGYMYSNGYGVNKDNSKALELYKKAANMGFAGAYKHLGIMHEEGEGVEKDNEKAIEFYEQACTLGGDCNNYKRMKNIKEILKDL